MPWGRASALDRHLVCPAASWWPRLDQDGWQRGYLDKNDFVPLNNLTDPSSPRAEWGTQMHLAKANSEIATEPWISIMGDQNEKYWPARLGRHEVCAAFDCETGKAILGPSMLSRADSSAWKCKQADSCITGELDWLGELPSGIPWVDDLKTGWPRPSPLGAQFKFAALIAARVSNYKECRVSVTHWRRDWSTPNRYWVTMTEQALDIFEAELMLAWREASKGRKIVPGSQCIWCPSSIVCPAERK